MCVCVLGRMLMICEYYPTPSLSGKSSYFREVKPGEVLKFTHIFTFLASFVGVLHDVPAKQIG